MMETVSKILAGICLAPALLAANHAQAQSEPDPAQCEGLRADEEPIGREDLSITIPQDWSDRAVQTGRWLAIATARGATLCEYLGWMSEAEPAEALSERLLGIAWTGHEGWGYLLIDTGANGGIIDTGARPVLSPSGRRLAFVQWSDAGWGGFEGFAVYDIRWSDVAPLHVDTALPEYTDWQVDNWEGEDCVVLSAVPWDRLVGSHDRLAEAERDRFVARAGDGWRLTPDGECPPERH